MNLLKQQKKPLELFPKKMFLEISQYLQENIYVGISLKAFRPAVLFKQTPIEIHVNIAKFLRTPTNMRTTAS